MERYKAADAEEAVAKLTVDQNVTAHSTAQAAVAAAEATVDPTRRTSSSFSELISFQRVLAPFNGTVIQRNVDVGALITAGSPTNNTAVAPSSVTGAANGLFEVAQIDTLRVFVNVPQAYGPNVKVGLPVQVTVRGQLEAAGDWHGNPNGQRARSGYPDTPDAGRHSQPVASVVPWHVRLREFQDRPRRHALAGSRDRGHLQRARHPRRDRRARETSCIFNRWCSAVTWGPRSTSILLKNPLLVFVIFN